jgi:hypothetical protein
MCFFFSFDRKLSEQYYKYLSEDLHHECWLTGGPVIFSKSCEG